VIDDGLDLVDRILELRRGDDAALVAGGGIAHAQAQEEAIHLRLGQRIGAEVLERVLRRDDDERLLELVGVRVDRYAPFGHRLEQRRLRARRGAVDLVGEDDVGEDRALAELEALRLLVEDADAEDVRRQEVRGELDAPERAADGAGERAGERGLADAGHVLDEHMAARRQRSDGEAHYAGLAVDDLGDGGFEAGERGAGVARRANRWNW